MEILNQILTYIHDISNNNNNNNNYKTKPAARPGKLLCTLRVP